MLDERRRAAWDRLDLSAADVAYDVPLAARLGFGVGGPADVWVRTDDEGTADAVATFCRKQRLDLLIVEPDGALLVQDGGLRGIAVSLDGPLATRWRLAPPVGALLPPATPERRPTGPVLPLFAEPARGPSVARLIADSGLGGVRVRGARLAPDDGGWVLNEGGATARDVLALRDWLHARIATEWGQRLAPGFLVAGRG